MHGHVDFSCEVMKAMKKPLMGLFDIFLRNSIDEVFILRLSALS